jgi:hypothetical protein
LAHFVGLNAGAQTRIDFAEPVSWFALDVAAGASPPRVTLFAPDGGVLANFTRPKRGALVHIGYVAEIGAIQLDWPGREGLILRLEFEADGADSAASMFAEAAIDETTCAGIVFAETASLRSTAAPMLAKARRFVAGVAYKRNGSGTAPPKIPTEQELHDPNIKREWDLCRKAAKDAASDDVASCRHFVIWPLDAAGEGPATNPKIPASWPYDHKDKISEQFGPFKNPVPPIGDKIYVLKYCGVP